MLEYRDEELLGEGHWQLFARATATPHAFTGHHRAIADIFHAWAPGAVANADLSFSTRGTAEQAPRLLYEEMRIHVALGALMNARNVDLDAARELLRNAARRGGISEAALAERLIAGVAQDEHELEE